MDEGWAAFFDVVVSDSIAGKPVGRMRNYWDFAGTENDMPPMTPSRHLSNPAYRVASYNRPQAAYFALYQMLGYERFHRCMVTYMDRWKGKHPQPFDFFNTWNAASGENLNWFWKPWFFDWGYPDLAVTGVQNNGGRKPLIEIENKGTMPMSVMGEIEYADGSKENFVRTAEVWKTGAKKISIPARGGKMIQRVTLGNRQVSDTDAGNNVWKAPEPKK
jgi:aminopeptidase N